MKVVRKSEFLWKTIEVLEVSFTDLVVPDKCNVMNVAKFRKLMYYCKLRINKY